MATNYTSVNVEKFANSALREPHGVVLQADFEADGLVRLIDDDLVSFGKGGRVSHYDGDKGGRRGVTPSALTG